MPDLDQQLRSYLDALAEQATAVASEHRRDVDDRPRSRRWPLLLVAAAVVVALSVGLAVRDEETDTSDLAVGPAATTTPAPPEDLSPVAGEWRQLQSTRPTGTELSPFIALLDPDRALVLSMEDGGGNVAGEILDLSSGTATAIAESPLEWRAFALVGWTGTEVIVTGGSNGPGIGVAGAAYDPRTDSWRQISDPPDFVPGRSDNLTIGPGAWTGAELISWQSSVAYNPSTDTWREIAPFPLAPRMDEAVTATNGDLLVWGGCDNVSVPSCDDALQAPLTDGALYDPESDRWTVLPAGPLDGGAGALAVDTTWDGNAIIVVPHPSTTGAATAAAINPGSLEWTELPSVPDGAGKRASALVWTGAHLITWGGYTESYLEETDAGFMLDPTQDRWRPLPPGGGARRGHAAIWTQHGLLVAGGSPTAQPALFTPAP
jgi:hypothetical protein